jgi:ABC-type Mn2+/Zn2+ transport system permease subunit
MNFEVLNSFSFFLPQLILGSIVGILLSMIGSFLVLRNSSFFGLTLAQVVSSGVAISLYLGIEGEWFAIIFSLIVISPMIASNTKSNLHNDTLLGILFVFFASFSQFLLSMGGNVKNQIMTAYFGDILTNQVIATDYHYVFLLVSILIFSFFFKKFLFLSFDREEFKIRQNHLLFYELLFHAIIIIIISVAVHLLGSFYATAHLLVPGFVALKMVRDMRSLLISCALISFISTLIGFTISLIGFEHSGEVIYFPTSSTIVVVLSLFGLLVHFFKKQ